MAINANKRSTRSLFIFRRDLRCDDNLGFLHALAMSERVIPCVFVDSLHDQSTGDNALQFMHQALDDLDEALHKKGGRLYFFQGPPVTIIKKIKASIGLDAVFINRAYTPHGRTNEEQLARVCAQQKIELHCYDDAVLVTPEIITKRSGGYYTVFTPFCKALLQHRPEAPVVCKQTNFYDKKLAGALASIQGCCTYKKNKHLAVHASRKHVLALLKKIANQASYDRQRNLPALDATTHLSAYIAVGLCSVREVYHAVATTLGAYHTLIKQLCWHDFFISIALHHPEVFKGAFHKKYNKLAWKNSRADFKRWCEGTTGFPIVDAGMRELNATGFMHNRLRMIVGSFLVKDLHIDWRWGEAYFAEKLIDYDPAVNNGNWQWIASTGCDAQPYFRIFNPWLQQKTYDRDCAYIKRWIPELSAVPSKEIHAWATMYSKHAGVYHEPMVDHAKESGRTKAMYKKAAARSSE
ncbi:MAG: deoxyribodipyrimidine photo-lyase [Candidatus Babeliales bacterium]